MGVFIWSGVVAEQNLCARVLLNLCARAPFQLPFLCIIITETAVDLWVLQTSPRLEEILFPCRFTRERENSSWMSHLSGRLGGDTKIVCRSEKLFESWKIKTRARRSQEQSLLLLQPGNLKSAKWQWEAPAGKWCLRVQPKTRWDLWLSSRRRWPVCSQGPSWTRGFP